MDDLQAKAQSICPGDSTGKHRTSEGCLCYRIFDALTDAFRAGVAWERVPHDPAARVEYYERKALEAAVEVLGGPIK